MTTSPKGRLFVIPSTLGLVPVDAVIPRRTLEIARGVGHFVAETPKAARRFIKEINSALSLQAIDIAELSEHTPAAAVEGLLGPALHGNDLGLLSDAGCPGVADPGAMLVAAAHRADVPVVPLPGSSAIVLALMASGLNGQSFCFHGYLPVKPGARTSAIKSLDETISRTAATQIFIETPYRNEAMVNAVLSACRASTQFCVAAGLNLDSEQIICRTIAAWRKAPRPALSKRPAVFLLGRG